MKAIGAALIVTSGALWGSFRAWELRERYRLLEAVASALELLSGEVTCRLTPLPEAAELLARSGPEVLRDFFGGLAADMDQLGRRGFADIWRERVAALQGLDGDEAEALGALSGTLGRYGAQEQQGALERCREYFTLRARQAQAQCDTTGRMYAGLGVTAGLITAVALL